MNRRRFLLSLCGSLAGCVLGGAAKAGDGPQDVAIGGYDPVAYFTESRPVIGDPRYAYEWDGAVYRFASARHRELFIGDPEHYAPQFGGFCTASLARGKKVVADPLIWAIQDDRLYLFSRPAGPDLLRKDPEAMKAAAKKHLEAGS